MANMNVLLTCVGRRNYLVSYFKEVSGGLVVGADASSYAPGMAECDKSFVVPKVDSPDYVPSILKICRGENIGLLCSLNDLDLPVLSKNIEKFSPIGTCAAVSSEKVIDICFDKIKTSEFLKGIGLNAPDSHTSLQSALYALSKGEISYPLVVKPRWGSGSIGLYFADNENQLKLSYSLIREKLASTILSRASSADWDNSVMIQPKLSGEEYGLDIVNDFKGKNVAVFVKRKLRMRAGETDMARSCDIPFLSGLGKRIGENLGHIGNLDCDVFFDGNTAVVLEMNPRFGGGYPFTHQAGANIPKAYIAWAEGGEAPSECFNFRINEIYSKCDRLVKIKE